LENIMLKLNVGFTKKVGEANYGSRGASVSLELESDSGLASDPERLKEKIRYLFGLAKASVEEELHNQQPGSNGTQTDANGNGHTNGRRRDGSRKATASQVLALNAIASRQNLSATNVVQSRYGVDSPEDLSITEASELIDSLKAAGKGNGERR
jgi:hypothetical protein